MTFITEIIAVQARYKERQKEIEATHAVNVEAIESRFRRELEEYEDSEISVQSRQDLLHMAEEWRLAAIRTTMQERDNELGQFVSATAETRTTARTPCTTCSESNDRVRSNLCAARLVDIECNFEAVKKQRFICPNCPSLGGHRPQGRCRVCPDQD